VKKRPDPELPQGDDAGDDVPVHVEDKRFWARAQEGDAASDDAAGGSASEFPTFVQELQAKLDASEKRLDETLAAHRRMQSEFDQVRARLQRDFEGRVRLAKGDMFRKLLEIADHMDLALKATEGTGSDGEDPLAQGVRLIHGRLLAALREEGVERMEVLGKPFDPEESEALAVVPVEDPQQHDCVVGEIRPGYRLGELTVRPAQVQVGKHPNGRPIVNSSEGDRSEGTEPGC